MARLPAYLNALIISCPSDALTFLLGDKALFFVPNRNTLGPKRNTLGPKRNVGLPGETIELKEKILRIKGEQIDQVPLDRNPRPRIPRQLDHLYP